MIVLFASALAFGGCSMVRATKATGNPNEHFMVIAAQTNQAEIATGKLALERASSPEVKQFGQRMIEDHKQANQELMQLANQKGMSLPDRPDEMHVVLAAHLEELEGAMFDREYISAMTADHAKVVSLFQDKAKLATDPDVRIWAERMLPVLRAHLEAAKALNESLGGASTVTAAAGS